MKTPEELAKKYADKHALTGTGTIEKKCFLAGYQAAKEINSSNNSNGWISVKDGVPERRKGVLFLHRSYGHNIGFYDLECRKPGYEWFSMEWTDVPSAGVTHWMPLPQPPKEEA